MHIPHSPKYPTFPWRDGNRARLLIDGDAFYPSMLAAIEGASSHIVLEMYLMESGAVATRFIDAFCAAAKRGVAVHMLLDDFGARGLGDRDRDRLRDCGVDLAFFNRLQRGRMLRNLLRDHRKLLLVDSDVAFVGGAGITDEFDPPTKNVPSWRETMLQIHGPVVADWQALFVLTWQRYAHRPLPLPSSRPAPAGEQRGRVCYSRGIIHPELAHSAIGQIRRAQRRVWFATAYFVPALKFRRALRQAAERGVDVRLLLPGPHTDHPAVRHAGRRFYHRLLQHGVHIFEYQSRFNHSKVLLCDDWTSIGSSNFDRWTLRWNLEANQEIEDRSFAAEVAGMISEDLEQSRPVLLEHWLGRPWHLLFLERFWGKIDIWMERHLSHRRRESDD